MMGNAGWFLCGLLAAQFLYLVTANTPDRAIENLDAWWAVISRR